VAQALRSTLRRSSTGCSVTSRRPGEEIKEEIRGDQRRSEEIRGDQEEIRGDQEEVRGVQWK
jgi:hypothetical protein